MPIPPRSSRADCERLDLDDPLGVDLQSVI